MMNSAPLRVNKAGQQDIASEMTPHSSRPLSFLSLLPLLSGEGQPRLPDSRLEPGRSRGKAAPTPREQPSAARGARRQAVGIMGESTLEPGSGAPAAGPVHAVTVVTLLEKLASMLEALRERQGGLAQRQGGLAGSVRRIQSGLGALSRSHDTTSNTLAQLLAKAERVGSHADAAQQRALSRAARVQRLEANHGLLVARGKLHVLLFKEEAEIPARAFQKAPEPSGPEEPSELGPEQPEEDEDGESSDEEPVESRARRLRRTGLQKVQSLRRALSGRRGNGAPVKPPRLGPGRSAEGPSEGHAAAQPAPEPTRDPEPLQDKEEDPASPGAAEAPLLPIESAA